MKQTLYIDQGTDFNEYNVITNFDGTPVNVAGYVFSGTIRKNPYSTLPSDILNVSIVGAPANGNVLINFPAANSANLEYGTYIYTVTQKNTANQTSVLQDGFLQINPNAGEAQPTPQTVVFPQTYPNTSYFNTANSNQYA